jgi:hypothetical protein
MVCLRSAYLLTFYKESQIVAGDLKCTLNPSCLKYLNHALKNIERTFNPLVDANSDQI